MLVPAHLNPIGRRIYDEILKLPEHKKLEPTVDENERRAFMDQFSWENSQLPPEEQAIVERLLVSITLFLLAQRFDIGFISEFGIKLTPKHDEPVSVESLPPPTNLKEEMLVEVVLQQEYGLITTLPLSKY